MKPVSLIGAPTDIGASVIGARLGPGALRVAGIQRALEHFGNNVVDRGDLTGPDNPMLPPVDGYRHLPEVIAWNQTLHDAVFAELEGDRLPITLGGDHCLAVGSISAVVTDSHVPSGMPVNCARVSPLSMAQMLSSQ